MRKDIQGKTVWLGCLLWTFAKALSDQDDNIGLWLTNRQVHTAITAPSWPTTPESTPFCEVWSYIQEQQTLSSGYEAQEWTFLDHVMQLLETCSAEEKSCAAAQVSTYLQAESIALEAARRTYNNDSSAISFMEYTVMALRSYSPTCELHRGLARDALVNAGIIGDVQQLEAFVVLYPGAVLITSIDELENGLRRASEAPLETVFRLPHEGSKSLGEGYSDTTAILYGKVASPSFIHWYHTLHQQGASLNLLVRHMGDAFYDERENLNVSKHNENKVFLQGYGVRLDIRNMDYNVLDASKKENSNTTNNTANSAESIEHNKQQENDILRSVIESDEHLAGIHLTKLLRRLKVSTHENDSFLRSVAYKLYSIHRTQRQYEQYVPKYLFEKEFLSLQAASAIVNSKDVLYALRDICQNIPARARYLQQLEVPAEIRSDAEKLYEQLPFVQHEAPSASVFGVFVNGNHMYVERPSFNMFEFMNTLRQEQGLLSNLGSIFPPSFPIKGQHLIHQLIMTGGSPKQWERFGPKGSTVGDISDGDHENDYDTENLHSSTADIRIDVGRGGKGVILYLNDIETDPRYRPWSTSLQALVYAGMGMGPPSVRRNLFTMLIVINPLQPTCPGYEALEFATQLVQSGYPIRLGLLMIDDRDVREMDAAERGGIASWEPLKYEGLHDHAQVYHFSELIHDAIDRYGDGFIGLSILLSFQQYVSRASGVLMTVEALIEYYLEFIAQISRQDPRFEEEARDLIMDQSSFASKKFSNLRFIKTYKSSLKLASSKKLSSGDTFLNGRPIPPNSNSFESVFQKEMSHLSNLVMKGDITEQR